MPKNFKVRVIFKHENSKRSLLYSKKEGSTGLPRGAEQDILTPTIWHKAENHSGPLAMWATFRFHKTRGVKWGNLCPAPQHRQVEVLKVTADWSKVN